jgi:hypothetical protein
VNQAFDSSFSGSLFDAGTVHPIPNLILGGRTYQLGNFMSKELQLTDFQAFFVAARRFARPCISDEDNSASLYRDEVGWTIHRKRAWTAIMSGAHYDFIDFSIVVGTESGTRESRAKIRSWMRNLADFISSLDFVHAKPVENCIVTMPEHLVASVLGQPGKEYVTYLADAREVTEATAGQPISGRVSFQLDGGRYDLTLYSPVTGLYSPSVRLRTETRVTVDLQPFQHDIVLRMRRVS